MHTSERQSRTFGVVLPSQTRLISIRLLKLSAIFYEKKVRGTTTRILWKDKTREVRLSISLARLVGGGNQSSNFTIMKNIVLYNYQCLQNLGSDLQQSRKSNIPK